MEKNQLISNDLIETVQNTVDDDKRRFRMAGKIWFAIFYTAVLLIIY